LVRLPSSTITAEESEEVPQQSKGADTTTSNVGLIGMGALSLILGIAVFVIMLRSPEEDELLVGAMLDDQGEPDSEGMPMHTDESGVLWRRNEDGEVDWWDRVSMMWKRW